MSFSLHFRTNEARKKMLHGTMRMIIVILCGFTLMMDHPLNQIVQGSLFMDQSVSCDNSRMFNAPGINGKTMTQSWPLRIYSASGTVKTNSKVSSLQTMKHMHYVDLSSTSDQNPNDEPNGANNGTIVVDMPQGGVAFTIVTNLSVGAVFLILFILFRPCLPLFNLKEKKTLLKNVKENIRSRNNYINYKDKGGDIYPTVDEDLLETSSIINREKQDSKFAILLDFKDENNEDDEMEEDVEKTNTTIATPVSLSEYNLIGTSSPVIEDNPRISLEHLSQAEKPSQSASKPQRKNSFAKSYQTKMEHFKASAIEFGREKWEFLVEFVNFSVDVLLSFVSRRHNHEDMERLLNRYSRDVAVYLLFQKEFISAMVIISALCAIVLLPIHLTQQTDIENKNFDFNGFNVAPSDYPLLRTTISTVLDSPFLLLIHVFLSFVVSFVFGLFLFRFTRHDIVTTEHYGSKNEASHTAVISSHSVLVQDLPSDFNSEPQFEKMVREELCPGLNVVKAVLIYDVYDRIQMQNDYQDICDQLEHNEFLQDLHIAHKRTFWRYIYRDRTRKIETLRKRKRELRLDMQHWDAIYHRVKNDEYGAEHDIVPCLKYGFIVFESTKDAQTCIDNYYKRGDIKMPIRASTISDLDESGDVVNISTIRTISFQIKQAYEPNDINWENMLTYTGFWDGLRNFLMQFVVILIFIFLTTPMALFSSLESLTRIPIVHISLFKFKESAGEFGSVIFQYTPTLALHLFSIFLPYGIWYAQDFSKFRSKSRYMRKLISRLFIYLVLSTLIMPMLSLTSFDAFINLVQQQGNISEMLSNMFLPGAGSYFFNFVLQTAILKNCEDILRVYNLIYYLWGTRYLPKCSPLQKLKACELSLFYFEYEYPFMLSILAICITNSLFSPLILFCCLLYLFFKHLVDRYVIMYIYGHVAEGACQGVLTNNFKSHRKLISLLCSLVMSIMAIYHGSMTLFFGIRIKANAWFISHTVLSGIAFTGIMVVWFTYFTKNTTAKDFIRQRIFKPIRNIFLTGSITSNTNGSLNEDQEIRARPGEPHYYNSYGSDHNSKVSFSTLTKPNDELLEQMKRAYEPPFKYFINELEADRQQVI
ncbi:hypothetical protein FDP41_002486 [Naegleria fowleri]|uniref:CSC1/OSCA1-like 7TM region domain-containing protein n=1 Tax=Naegleria fowleri TaxID=5763 RepID=A0A6A5BTW7_NAEFO|nr:uncharacterized protein FDP41_002486 [Naegleria fowleri]KAF0978666.1 hypothetical protein FDP41_002486 [Naegleria fowleri]